MIFYLNTNTPRSILWIIFNINFTFCFVYLEFSIFIFGLGLIFASLLIKLYLYPSADKYWPWARYCIGDFDPSALPGEIFTFLFYLFTFDDCLRVVFWLLFFDVDINVGFVPWELIFQWYVFFFNTHFKLFMTSKTFLICIPLLLQILPLKTIPWMLP